MNKRIFILVVMAFVLASCNLPASATPGPQFETPVVTAVSSIPSGGVVTLNNVSMTLPLGVATDAQTEMVPANTDSNNSPWWEIAPAHLKFKLTGYQLQDKFHEPTITVYPTDEYAKLDTIAPQQIERLKAILAGGALTKEAMPLVPFFNAGPAFASHMQIIDFKNGRGVRMVTQYDQYPAPVNNHELFYHFQGLTDDGKYYIVAVLPVTASVLAENDKPDAAIPPGGVSLPASGAGDQAYYEAVTKALDAMYEDSFNPSLFQLDALIQSITVNP